MFRRRFNNDDPRVPNGPCVEFVGPRYLNDAKDGRHQWREEERARAFLRIGDHDGQPGVHNRIESIMPYIEKGWSIVGFHNIPENPEGAKLYAEIQMKARALRFMDGVDAEPVKEVPLRGTQRKLEAANAKV